MANQFDDVTKDEETGFGVRQSFLETLARQIAVAKRSDTPLSVILFELGNLYKDSKAKDPVLAKCMIREVAETVRAKDYDGVLREDSKFYLSLPYTDEQKSQDESVALKQKLDELSAQRYQGLKYGIAIRTLKPTEITETPEQLLQSLDMLVCKSFETEQIVRYSANP